MLNKSLTISQRNKVCLEEEMKNLKLLSDAAILRSQQMQVSKQHEVNLQARCYDLQKEALGKENSFLMLAASCTGNVCRLLNAITVCVNSFVLQICLITTVITVCALCLWLSFAVLPLKAAESSGYVRNLSSTKYDFSRTKWNLLCCRIIPRGFLV